MSTALLNAREESENLPFPDHADEPTTQIPVVDDGMAEPEAPWGRRADGTPRAKPGAKPSGTPRKAAAPRARKAAPAGARKAKAGEPDYRPALIALLQLPVFVGNLAARGIKDDKTRTAVQLDALTLKVHSPNLAEALNETAKTQPALASVLDRLVTAGPYGMIFAAAVPMVMQMMCNHGAIEPNPEMGIHTPDALIALASA